MSLVFAPMMAEHVLAVHESAAMPITPELAVIAEETAGWSVIEGSELLAIGGIAWARPGVGLAWSVLTRNWRRRAKAITRRCLAELDAAPYRRIEAVTPTGFTRGHRWLRRLGFEVEAERMRAWGAEGEDYSLYARVN